MLNVLTLKCVKNKLITNKKYSKSRINPELLHNNMLKARVLRTFKLKKKKG